MKKTITLLVLSIFVLNCSDHNTEPEVPPTVECKVTKYQKSDFGGNTYNIEFKYNGDHLIQRLNYGNILSGSTGGSAFGLKSTNDVFYDSNNRPVKIVFNSDEYEDLIYNSAGKIIEKRNYKIYSYINYTEIWSSKYTFDSKNRISNIQSYYIDDPDFVKQTTILVYNTADNLESVTKTSVYSNYTEKTVTNYSNYDDHKNPFLNFKIPFDDFIPMMYSKNNYRTTSFNKYLNNNLTSYSNNTFQLIYNADGLPDFAEYKCE